MKQPQTFIFIGRSGCGKGTQIDLLVKYLTDKGLISAQTPFLRSESGNMFRQLAQADSYTGRLVKEAMSSGARMPDASAIWNWFGFLAEKYTGKEILCFDGSPRSLLEAEALETVLSFFHRDKPIVIHLDVSREWSKKRLEGRGRADDLSPEKINRRLDWYEKDVLPAINYYVDNPNYQYLKINGEQTIEEVHEEIKRALEM
jgi:adenylate kinase